MQTAEARLYDDVLVMQMTLVTMMLSVTLSVILNVTLSVTLNATFHCHLD